MTKRALRQMQAYRWAKETFGDASVVPWERARRFLEEALETAQAFGVTQEQAFAILVRTYSRPAGAKRKELGQAGLTLEMLAESVGLDAEQLTQKEFDRVRKPSKQAEFQARLARKVAEGIAQ